MPETSRSRRSGMMAFVAFVALEEIHAAALRALPDDVAAYLEEGAGTESTLRANRAAFGKWVIRPRPMSGVSDPDMSATVLGIPLRAPILTSPFGGDAQFQHHRAGSGRDEAW